MSNWLLNLGTMVVLVGCGGGDSASNDAAMTDARVLADALPPDADPSDAGAAVIPEDLPDPLPSGAPDLTVITFNVGLIQTINGAPERIPHIVDALEVAQADVICLQEVFTQYTSPFEMAEMLVAEWPYAFWTWTHENNISNGLLILSKWPLYRGRELRFTMNDPNGVVDRMIIGATTVADEWYAHILCTHLQAGLSETYAAIRSHEIGEIKTFAMSEGYFAGPSFLLGDFNTGPDPYPDDCECDEPPTPSGPCTIDCVPAEIATYGELLEDWTDPNEGSALVTFSRATALSMMFIPGMLGNEPDKRIDHCLYRGIGEASFVSAELMFEEPLNITVGETLVPWLSDHRGLRCQFSP